MNVQHSIGTPVRWAISAIGLMSATTVRAAQLALDVQRGRRDLARQPLDVGDDVRAGARQADVGRVDPERVHPVEDVDLLVDRRRPHRRRLQAVAQRLVVEHRDRARRRRRRDSSRESADAEWAHGGTCRLRGSIVRPAERTRAPRGTWRRTRRRGSSRRRPSRATARASAPVASSRPCARTDRRCLAATPAACDVPAAGHHDHVVEDHVPDDHGPDRPERDRETRGTRRLPQPRDPPADGRRHHGLDYRTRPTTSRSVRAPTRSRRP